MFTTPGTQAKLGAALAGLCLAAAGGNALAQAYPVKPITILSPVPTGGAVDVATRSWMTCAQQLAGQPMVLVNRPGANGVVAASALRQAPPDGYTFLITGMSQTTIAPFVFKKQPFDPEKDFHGVAALGDTAMVLVTNPQTGVKSVKELQAYARARPKGLDMGHAGIAHATHLLSAAFVDKAGIPSTLIPFNGEGAATTALLAGEIQATVLLSGTAAPFIANGKMVPLLAFTQKRLPSMPNVPSVVEELNEPGLARTGWLGLTAWKGTPQAAVDAMESWTKTCMDKADVRKSFEGALFTPHFASQKEFSGLVRRDIAFWRPWIARLDLMKD